MSQVDAHRALKNSLFLFARMVVVLFIGLYTSRVVLRTLGFEDYGIYNVVGSVVLFFTFLNTALTGATSRFLTYELGGGDPKKLRRTFSMAVNAHIMLALLMVLLLEAGGVWFINHKLNIAPERMAAANWCFQLSVLSLAINVMAVPFSSSIIAHEHMNYYALVSILESLLKLGAVFTLVAVKSDKLIAYSALLLGVTVIVRLMYALYCHFRLKDCRYERCFDTKLLGQFASFSGYSLLTSSADGITIQSRNIFFNWFTGLLANAAMGVANQVIGVINGFVDTFTQAISPQIIKSYASGNWNYFMRLIFSSAKLNFILFALVSFPVALNMDFLLGIWLGEFPPYAGPFILAILVYTIFDVIQQPLWSAIHATGNIKVHEILMSSIKVLVIPATYFALKSGLSPVTALYIWAGFNVVCAIVRTIYAHFLINLSLRDYLKKVIIPILTVSLLAIPLPLWLSTVISNGWIKLFVTGILSVITICLAGYLVGLDSQERVFVSSLGPVKRILSLFRK